MRNLLLEAKQRRLLSGSLLVTLLAQLVLPIAFFGAIGLVLIALAVSVQALFPANRISVWKYLRLPAAIIAVGTTLLTLIYLPFTHFNPAINWQIERSGSYAFPPPGEIDPTYLILAFPAVELVVSLVLFGLFGACAQLLSSLRLANAV